MDTPTIELAAADDAGDIERLLQACALPTDGFRSAFPNVLVARDGPHLVGSAALETYRSSVLLRSVAVDQDHRGRGVGEALIEGALVLARSRGATTAFLLTTTAADFFRRFGFEPIGRGDVPDDVKQSVEFVSACPSSAVVMRAYVRGHVW